MSFIPSESPEAASEDYFKEREWEALEWKPLDLKWARESLGFAPFKEPDTEEVKVANLQTADSEISLWTGTLEGVEHDDTWTSEVYEPSNNESVEAPFINRLVQDDVLDSEVAEDMKLAIMQGSSLKELQNLLPEKIRKDALEKWEYINNTDNFDKNRELFEKDFWNVAQNMKNESGEFISEWDKLVYEKIGAKYSVAEQADDIEQWRAFDMAIGIALNEIVWRNNFERSLDFQIKYENVIDSSESEEKRIKSLSSIAETLNDDQASKWGRRKMDRQTAQKKEMLRALLREKYTEAQAQLQTARKEDNQKAMDLAQAQMDEAVEQASLWDIWANWDTALETWWIEWWKSEKWSETA